MEDKPSDIEKIEEEDEDNMGKDNYFMMGRKDDLSESDMNDGETEKIIPNLNNYLNGKVDDDINEIIENPHVNPGTGIINNKIEENVKSKDVINLNDISDNSFVNNVHNNNNENNLSVNQKENGSINPNELNNNNPKVESEIVERLSSSSSDNGDIKIISSQQFTDHFQKRNEPKARIEVVENNIISNKDIKDFLRKRKQQKNDEDFLKAFFNEKESKNNNNNKIKEMPKKNPNFNFNFNRNKKQPIKYKEFIPLLKEDFRSNTYFDKLLINRVEHQVLTEIYRSYENKEEFNRTNYYINEIKNIINHEGVEKAIQFLDNIEPLELREKIAIESTYFFKEVVREEVENAKVHNGELILIKQPEHFYNQNIYLKGKINHKNNNFQRKGNSFMRYGYPKFMPNNMRNNQFNNNMNNDGFEFINYNNINQSGFVYNKQIFPNRRMSVEEIDEDDD